MEVPPIQKFKDKRKEVLKSFNLPTKLLGIPAPYVSYFLVRFTSISSNQIVFFWTILQTIGISLIAIGNYWLTIAGIILSHIAMMLDQVDGDMARARRNSTFGGPYLDDLAQVLSRSLLIFVLGVGLYNSGFSILYLYLGAISAFVFIFSAYSETKINQILLARKKIKYLQGKTKSKKKVNIPLKKFLSYFRPAEPMNIIYVALIFNLLSIASYILIAYSVFIPLVFIKKFYNIYKKVGNLENDPNYSL